MKTLKVILQKAASSAFRGGISGAIAMVLQVVLLMWLRTVVNYQYRNGGTISEAFTTLYAEGGILRFYQGAEYALIQGPLSRFGDTAANEGIKELLKDAALSMGVITAFASLAAALWRMALTPLDTLKTTLQVGGASGMKTLRNKIAENGMIVLYDGALGNWGASLMGHYPWFVVNNQLEKILPPATSPRFKLMRRAFIGFCSSVVSDCFSNSIRVLKTVKQTSEVPLSYVQALHQVIDTSGITGLLFRGLIMKLCTNVLSSIIFSIIWKVIMDSMQKRERGALSDTGMELPSETRKANDDKSVEEKALLDTMINQQLAKSIFS